MKANSSFEYCIRMGAANIMKHAAMSVAAIATTTACLLLMACMYMVSVNTNINMKNFQAENAMLAFVEDNVDAELELQLEDAIRNIQGVKDMHLITKEEAFQSYSEQYGGQESKYLTSAIFRDRFAIEVSRGYKLEEVKERVESLQGIADVRSDETITNGFQAFQSLIRLIGATGIILLSIVSIFIVINTIKLTMSNRREEYEVMQMMGASDSFLRIPLLSEGAITGGFSALAAFILAVIIYLCVKTIMSGVGILSLVALLPLHEIAMPMLCITLCIGMGIGIGGSYLGIRKFLTV